MIVENETVAKQVASKQAIERADSSEMRETQQKAIEAQQAQKRAALDRLLAIREGEQVEDPKEVERMAAAEEEKRAAREREYKMLIKTVRLKKWSSLSANHKHKNRTSLAR